MPVPIIAAGIGAAGVLGGSLLSSNASTHAADLQSKANADALAFKEKQYNEMLALDKQRYDAWNNNRLGLMRRMGINVPDSAFSQVGNATPTPISLADLGGTTPSAASTGRGVSLADLTGPVPPGGAVPPGAVPPGGPVPPGGAVPPKPGGAVTPLTPVSGQSLADLDINNWNWVPPAYSRQTYS